LRLKIKLAGLKVDEEPVADEKSDKAKTGQVQVASGFRLRN
jgi:hypothetical protein